MLPPEKYYLRVAKAADLKSPKERYIYRAFEILPGFLAWGTLLGAIFFSWYKPVLTAFFIITFDIYWLIKTIYLIFHLRSEYKQVKGQMMVDWLAKVKSRKKWQEIYHLIILPVYKEPIEVVRPAFQAIVNSDYPKEKMLVVLALEERTIEQGRKIAAAIEKEFSGKFFKFLRTTHPQDIVGEIAAKSSNCVWAARQAKEKLIDVLKIPYQNIVVSCFDIDTQAWRKYFSCLTWHYLTAAKPTRTSYQPIPIYNNNIWQAPCFSRVVATSATFWQMMQQQRPERLSTFSSQSISFQALVDVDFWQANMVSEDSRIFWQCLLFYQGDYKTIPLHCPVFMDANVASNLFKTTVNVYKQQRRWGWGVENIPFLFFGFLKEKNIPFKMKFHWIWIQLEGFWSWSTNSLLIFFLGWLPLFLGGQKFNVTLLSYNLPRITQNLMTIAMVGLVASAIYSTLLLPDPPREYGSVKKLLRYLTMIVQWILMPLTIIIFGAFPGLEAQTRLMLGRYMGFWVTEKKR